MNKNIIWGVVIVVLVIGGVYWFMQNRNVTSNTASVIINTPVSPSAPIPTPVPLPPAPTKPASLQGGATIAVTIQNLAFTKSSITIKKGDTVVWTNADSMGHTVTGNTGGPASPTISTNGTYSYTFNSVGTFPYHCSIHPSMTGTVVVTQ